MMDNFDSVPFHPSVQASLISGHDFSKKFRYKTRRRLGRGASSFVVEARDREEREDVAVKFYRKGVDVRSAFEQRFCFETEVSILSRIKHENIIQMVKACEDPDFYAIALPLMRGGNLINLLPDIKKEQTNKIFVQLTSAVHYLHSNGVVHRDIKPDNVLLTSQGDALLSDFGFSRVVGWKTTFLSLCLGTRAYMAPEISERPDGSPIDWYMCDMYSLGLVLWCMVARATPTSNQSLEEMLSAVSEPGRYGNTKLGCYEMIIHRLTMPNPKQRWHSRFLVTLLKLTWAAGHELDDSPTAVPRVRDLVDLKYDERYREFMATHRNKVIQNQVRGL